MPALIETRGLSRQFGELIAVNGLNLDIGRGEIFGLVGPDGAGKTTTLRLLAGLMKPSAGAARVAGYDTAVNPELVRDRIGYMPQRFGLYPDLTVEENMAFCADLFGISEKDRAAHAPRLLHMTRMEPFLDRQAGKLSGGMKQKLALMCTLLHRPEILLLDEPTNGVDPVSRRDFWAILYELIKGGLTVLVTTAYLDEAERCNRVGLMYQGKLISCDTPEALRRPWMGACYEVDIHPSAHRAARTLLQGAPGIAGVETAGATLHLFLGGSATPPEAVKQILINTGYGAAPFRPIAPSLEDLFILSVRGAGAN